MPNINDFLKKGTAKTDSKKNDWDLSSIISKSKIPSRPQRRPGRGEDAPNITTATTTYFNDPIVPRSTNQESVTDNKVERKYGESTEKVERTLERNQRESTEKVERISLTDEPGKNESREKVARKVESEPERKYGESREKVERKSSFSELIGLERKVTLFIFDQCQMMGSRVTSPISINHLCDYCQTVVSSAKRTILTLQRKAIVIRVEYKDGRGGWTKYSLTDSIFSEILQTETSEKLRRNQRESREKVESQLESKVERAFPSSSINVLEDLNTTTSNYPDNKSQDIPEEWLEITWSEDTRKAGFSINQLKQWYSRKYCTAREAQESIWHFEAQRKISPPEDKINTQSITYLMGVMASSKYFCAPDGYLSLEDQAREKRLQQQKTVLQRRQQQEEEYFKLVFEEFFDALSGKQIRALSPHMTNPEASKAIIREKFREKYWLEIRDAFKVNIQLDIRRFDLEQEIASQEKISSKLPMRGLLSHPTNSVEAEATALRAKLEQLKKLDEVVPSAGTKETIQRYEQRLHEIELSIETEVHSACEAQFGAAKQID